MVIQITRREVLNNLIRFKDNLLENESETVSKKRVYTGLFNRHTGEIRFAQQVAMPQAKISQAFNIKGKPADWMEIDLVAEDTQKTVRFHLTGPKGTSLKPTEIDPLAVRILFETLEVLNKLASHYLAISETLPEKAVLQHLSDLHIAPVHESIESMQGWSGRLSRIEAEKKLHGSPIGTYLLRHGDDFTEPVANAFSQANKMSVNIYVVTFVEEKSKISERLLIQTEWGWTIARDESDLSSPLYEYHPTISALLSSMSDQCKTPI
jgi:hypothetical protein